MKAVLYPVTNSVFQVEKIRQLLGRLLVLFAMLFVVFPVAADDAETPAGPEAKATYRLGPGDELQIDVFNQTDLSGNYTLDGDGHFDMHLIGQIDANNLTANELEVLLVSKLKPDYLRNPRISVQVQNYRPFYIIGEVKTPNSYDYVDGMSYLTAVAIAGGFTYRARKSYVYVIRGDDVKKKEHKLEISDKVQPGDIIRVAERLF